MDSYRSSFVPKFKDAKGRCANCRLKNTAYCTGCSEIFFNEDLGVIGSRRTVRLAEVNARFTLR